MKKKRRLKKPILYLLIILFGICFYFVLRSFDKEKNQEVISVTPSVTEEASAPTPTPTYDPETDERFYDEEGYLILANKTHKLREDYEPSDLVKPNVTMRYYECMLREEAAKKLEEMVNKASEEGLFIGLISGYRSYSYQVDLYNSYVSNHGQEYTDTFSSRPGYSDHQTGLAVDLCGEDINYDLSTEFENTSEGKWLHEHAHEYGFIMRYPKGKDDITGYSYEPWHFRYIGEEYATAIYETDEWYTFEEYFGVRGGYYEE